VHGGDSITNVKFKNKDRRRTEEGFEGQKQGQRRTWREKQGHGGKNEDRRKKDVEGRGFEFENVTCVSHILKSVCG
jgi:hypothetical protein